MATIVIIAQQGEVFEFLGYLLDGEGHEVRLIRNAKVISGKLHGINPSLIIVENGGLIKDVEGLCAQIRTWQKFCSVRILVVAPESESGGVARPCQGADAALARPLHPRAVLEQVQRLLTGKAFPPEREVAVEDLVLNPASYRATRSGRLLSLSVREFRVLYFLASHPNVLWSREQLIAAIWPKPRVTPRTVDVFIRRLRLQIEDDPDNPVRLCSVRGEGYSFQTCADTSSLPAGERDSGRHQGGRRKQSHSLTECRAGSREA